MARKTPSRLDKRREVEAADSVKKSAAGEAAPAKKKAAKRKTPAVRKKRAEKAPQRKRLIWGVFSGSMKEEARFPYDQRAAAEERLEQLRAKSKKLYFIQPIKEPIADSPPAAAAEK